MLTCHTMPTLENVSGGKGRCRYRPHSDVCMLSQSTKTSTAAVVAEAEVGGVYNHLVSTASMRKPMASQHYKLLLL